MLLNRTAGDPCRTLRAPMHVLPDSQGHTRAPDDGQGHRLRIGAFLYLQYCDTLITLYPPHPRVPAHTCSVRVQPRRAGGVGGGGGSGGAADGRVQISGVRGLVLEVRPAHVQLRASWRLDAQRRLRLARRAARRRAGSTHVMRRVRRCAHAAHVGLSTPAHPLSKTLLSLIQTCMQPSHARNTQHFMYTAIPHE